MIQYSIIYYTSVMLGRGGQALIGSAHVSNLTSHLLPRLHPVQLIQSIQCIPYMQNILCIQCTQCIQCIYTLFNEYSI